MLISTYQKILIYMLAVTHKSNTKLNAEKPASSSFERITQMFSSLFCTLKCNNPYVYTVQYEEV